MLGLALGLNTWSGIVFVSDVMFVQQFVFIVTKSGLIMISDVCECYGLVINHFFSINHVVFLLL